MKLSKSIKKTGFFWLPESPETRLPGILSISETGEIVLEINYLSDNSKHRITGSDGIDWNELVIISGIVENEDITLYKTIMIKQNHHVPLSYGVSNIIFHVHFALFGFEYKNEKEIMLSSMKVSIEGLKEWLFLYGISTQNDYEAKNYIISSEPFPGISMGNHDNFDLGINFDISFNQTRFDVNITQEAYFCLTSEKLRPLDDFLDMIYKVRTFLCFAIDRMVSIQSIISYSNDKLIKIQDNSICRPIQIYYKSFSSSNEITNIHRHGMLFPCSHIDDKFDRIIKKWLDSYNIIEPVFRLYFASSSMFNTYSSERFLLLVRAMEVFHRRNFDSQRFPDQEFENILQVIVSNFSEDTKLKSFVSDKMQFANEVSLRKRIKEIIYPFQNLFKSKKQIKSFVEKVTNTRNYLTHYSHSLENKAAIEGEDMYKLCIKIEALLQLHFLQLIGLNTETIQTIAKNNHHLRHKLDLD